ncbi:MAG TPA: hypothetical protein VJZ75_10335 [Candidatus Bathyarchaeia archaeon]|nr:hypothetical protein [Candidatus Bathyarchaeia archaeon]
MSEILFWIIAILGIVYCIVRRLAGRRVAKLAVAILILSLIREIIFGHRDD